jgi:hypothetical protein|tara:strand:+ start:289 stop:483 length:195 start_codon:yes stop_codon:yes gene_type:complete
MPLKRGKSSKTISKNVKELMKKPSKARSKGVSTLAKKLGVTKKEAQKRQAVAIALNAAGKTRKK